jgi:hypothetical protein
LSLSSSSSSRLSSWSARVNDRSEQHVEADGASRRFRAAPGGNTYYGWDLANYGSLQVEVQASERE